MNRSNNVGSREKAFVVIYVLCFLGAALNHLNDIRIGGWLPYRYAPVYLNAFWTSLLFFDLAVVFLLILRVKAGICLAIAVMVTDLLVNIPYFFFINDLGSYAKLIVSSQIVFAVFLVITAPNVFKAAGYHGIVKQNRSGDG